MASRTARATREALLEEFARRMLRQRLRAVGRAVSAVSSGNPRAEAVHRVRVAARRASATITAFRPLIPRRHRRWFKKSLRRIRDAAGEARDLDVLVLRCRAGTPVVPEPTARQRLVEALARRRPETRRGLQAGIANLRSRDWEARTASLIAAVASAKKHQTIALFVHRRSRQLVGRFLDRLDDHLHDGREIHRLRIDTKKLRYMLEVFAAATPRAADTASDRTLRLLQTRLGEFTDHAAAAERLKHWSRRTRDPRARHALVDARRRESAAARRAKHGCTRWWAASRREAIARQLKRTLGGKTA
jgi:CHAD domain-containing protein